MFLFSLLFGSWVVDIKTYTEGLVVERGLKFRSTAECREVLGIYTHIHTHTQRARGIIEAAALERDLI